MSLDKPSHAEDEYFQKEEQERLAELRKKLDAERDQQKLQQEKELHWMRCPKCGGEMKEELFIHVMVDRCTRCNYIGFDAGEIDLLVDHTEPTLSKFAKNIRHMFTLKDH